MRSKKTEKQEFLGAGTSRRTYSTSKRRCIKIPVEGREEAAALQNKAEFVNIKFAEASKLHCFPHAYSLSEDYKTLVVQKCEPVDNAALECAAQYVLCKAGYDLEKYKNVAAISTLAFSLGAVFKMLRDLKQKQEKQFNLPVLNPRHSELMALAENLISDCNEMQVMNFFYHFRFHDLGNLILTINSMKVRECMLARSLKDLLKFTLLKKLDFAFEDLWNMTQWGIVGKDGGTKRFIVLDAGFSYEVQKSGHYGVEPPIPLKDVVQTTCRLHNASAFNGESISEIHDPHGNSIKSKFFTSKMSEYILSSDNMARRIKKAGLQDDGLHQWTDKLVFVKYSDLLDVMNVIEKNASQQRPTRVESDWKTSLSLSSLNEDGQWTKSYTLSNFSVDPVIGQHVLEFNFDGDGIVKSYHFGHDVSYIQEMK